MSDDVAAESKVAEREPSNTRFVEAAGGVNPS